MQGEKRSRRLSELARLFLKLGVIGFGGPAAHIAMMEEEVVEKRGWLTRQHFLDLIGATNLIPGPNSTEMTMHVGYARAGWLGLAVAGFSFILPAATLTGLFAWMYVEYGDLPAVEPFLVGIKPAVLAIILGALWRLGKKAVSSVSLGILGVAVSTLLFLGVNEIAALLIGGLVGMVLLVGLLKQEEGDEEELDLPNGTRTSWFLPLAGQSAIGGVVGVAAEVSIWKLGFFFLKVGAVLYGSGYVLIAFLEGDLVENYGWLTQQQLLDAIAFGQLTPGPVLTTATFIGYVIAGLPGAVVATLGIFLPSFVFAGILHPVVPKLRKSKWTAAFLDAINVSAVALMLVVTISLGKGVLVDVFSLTVFLAAALAVLRFRVSVVWVVVGAALLGFIWVLLGVA